MKQRYCLLQIAVLLLGSLPTMCTINPKLLKGTVGIVPDAYAPFWGLSFIEENIAKQWYRLSPKQMVRSAALADVKPEDVALKNNVISILSAQQNSATENLIASLFVETGGAFNVTNAPNNPVRQLQPEQIGRVLKMVSENKSAAEIQKYLGDLKFIKPSGSVFTGKDFKPFVEALLGAVQECSTANQNALYPENTAQGVVLGYLLAKSNTRADLAKYFEGFTGQSVVLADEKYTADEIQKILKQSPDLTNFENFSDFMCAAVYKQNFDAPLPKVVENSEILYHDMPLSDCVETTMRNLSNIATYNMKEKVLGQAPEGVSMSVSLREFYDQELNQNPAEVGNKLVHQAWIDLVENVPGAVYNRLLVAGSKKFIEVREMCDGVIPVDEIDKNVPLKTVVIADKNYQVQEKKVGTKSYWLTPKDSGLLCCELMPTAANIVVVLNKLFDLKLYSSENEVLQPGFAEKYFKAMCEKLKWSISEDEMLKVVALEQGSETRVIISVTAGDSGIFKIDLNDRAHGSVSVPAGGIDIPVILSQELLQAGDAKTQAAYTSLGFVDEELYQDLKPGCLHYQSVVNPDDRLKMIKWILKNDYDDLYASYNAKLIMSMGNFADPHYQNSVFSMIRDDLDVQSQAVVKALVVMTSIACAKYNYPKFYLKYSQVLLQDKALKIQFDKHDIEELFKWNQQKCLESFRMLNELIPYCASYDEILHGVTVYVDTVEDTERFDTYDREFILSWLDKLINKKIFKPENTDALLHLISTVNATAQSNPKVDAAISSMINQLFDQKVLPTDSASLIKLASKFDLKPLTSKVMNLIPELPKNDVVAKDNDDDWITVDKPAELPSVKPSFKDKFVNPFGRRTQSNTVAEEQERLRQAGIVRHEEQQLLAKEYVRDRQNSPADAEGEGR